MEIELLHQDSAQDCSPSWAPFDESTTAKMYLVTLQKLVQACTGLDSPTLLGDLSHGPDVLLVEGFVADHIVGTNTIGQPQSFKADRANYHEWLLEVEELLQRHCAQEAEQSVDKRFLDMAFTLTAGQLYSGLRAQPQDLVMLSEHLRNLDTCEDEEVLNGFYSNFDTLRQYYCLR
jgi:hypothetical protein